MRLGVALGEVGQPGAAGHGGGDGDDAGVVVGKVGEFFAVNLRVGWGRRSDGLARIQCEFTETVKLVRLGERGCIPLTLLRENVENDGLGLSLEKLESAGEKSDVVAVDGTVVAEAEVLEDDAGGDQVFESRFGLVGKLAGGAAADPFDEFRGLVVEVGVSRIGDEAVEVFGNRSDVLRDGPLVVVEDDDESIRGVGGVIESFVTDAAGEGGVSGDADDVLVPAAEVTSDCHAERGGEGRAGVAGSVAVVLGFGAEKKTVEPAVLADGGEAVAAAGEEFMNVALVADVENESIGRGFENAVEGDCQLDDAEVGAEVSAGLGEHGDQLVADLLGENGQLIFGEAFDVGGRVDVGEEAGRGIGHGLINPRKVRVSRCHRRRG